MIATRRVTPDVTLHDLDDLNAWVFPRSLRNYQLLAFKGVRFSILLDGECWRFSKSRAIAGKNEVYFTDSGGFRKIVLRSGGVGSGYRLEGVAQVSSGAVPYLGANVVVRCGHPNFAHFIWNQLDAVLRLARVGEGQVSVWQDNETILDLGGVAGFFRVDGGGAAPKGPSLYVGSEVVSEEVRECIKSQLAPISREGRQTMRGLVSGGVRICLGIRGSGKRELTNEVDFYVALIHSFDPGQEVIFFLDGFTRQRNYIDSNVFRERQVSCGERIAKIISRCGSYRLVSLNGLSIDDFLLVARTFSFYVTHAGTMHHKVGWLYPEIPSILLTGHRNPGAAAQWHRENGGFPSAIGWLPPHLMEHARATGSGEPERDVPFRIRDIGEAVRQSRGLICCVQPPPGVAGTKQV